MKVDSKRLYAFPGELRCTAARNEMKQPTAAFRHHELFRCQHIGQGSGKQPRSVLVRRSRRRYFRLHGRMYRHDTFLFVAILAGLALSQDAENGAKWTTVTLNDPSIRDNDSDKAVAVGYEGTSFIVAVERTSPSSSSATPVLYKVTESGDLLWTLEAQGLRGTPFDIAVDQNQKAAYLVVSSAGVGSPYTVGHLVRYSGISGSIVDNDVRQTVSEEIVFTTDSVPGNTKLFGCALDPSNGDLYLTGGTSGSLYGESKGRSDVIVIRISSSGQVLATIQFGSVADEFGRAIDISTDSNTVAVAVQKVLETGGTESLLYRLDASTLVDAEGPQTLISYTATPLYTPTDVAISAPLLSEPGTVTTVVAGNALVIPDRKTDMFYHVFANIGDSESSVAVYVDGITDSKNNDYAVALDAGTDGNFYSIGYSSTGEGALSNSLTLVVISPTGETLYRSGQTPPPNTVSEESTAGMVSFTANSRINVAFVGSIRVGMVKRPSFGLVVSPADRIPVFKGFGSVVEGAEADSPSKPSSGGDGDKASGLGIMPIATGAVAGVLVLLVGVLAVVFFRRRQPRTTAYQDDRLNGIASPREQNSTLV